MERTKEEIEKVIDILADQIADCFTGCGVCPGCRRDRMTGIAMDGAQNALLWAMGDDNTPIGLALADDARREADTQAKMRTEKAQGEAVAALFHNSGIGEPKE